MHSAHGVHGFLGHDPGHGRIVSGVTQCYRRAGRRLLPRASVRPGGRLLLTVSGRCASTRILVDAHGSSGWRGRQIASRTMARFSGADRPLNDGGYRPRARCHRSHTELASRGRGGHSNVVLASFAPSGLPSRCGSSRRSPLMDSAAVTATPNRSRSTRARRAGGGPQLGADGHGTWRRRSRSCVPRRRHRVRQMAREPRGRVRRCEDIGPCWRLPSTPTMGARPLRRAVYIPAVMTAVGDGGPGGQRDEHDRL